MGFHSVNSTGMYREACREWQQKGDDDRTWTNFKYHFAAEYHVLREQQRELRKAGFNSTQLVHEITYMTTALENLALAATADCNIFTYLIAINKKWVETNTVLVSQVKYLVKKTRG